MLAEDIRPNRLTRALFEIESFIDRLEGDRIGLVAFAGPQLYPLSAHPGLRRREAVSGFDRHGYHPGEGHRHRRGPFAQRPGHSEVKNASTRSWC